MGQRRTASRRRAALCFGVIGITTLGLAGPASGTPSGTPTPSATPSVSSLAPIVVLPPTAVAGSAAPVPTTAGLTAALTPLLADRALGPAVSATVVDPATGTVLLDATASRPTIPASTLKTLTAVAALRALGPDSRLTTRVVRGSAPGQLVLVGGGDATLVTSPADQQVGHAGDGDLGTASPPGATLTDLAARTAAALAAERGAGAPSKTTITLVVDDSLFSGPKLGPGWQPSYPALGVVSPVSALSVDAGRTGPAATSRSADPAMAAATTFARLLSGLGVTVAGVVRGLAPTAATEVAAVSSPPLADVVERMLTYSDNDIAEALAHLAGRALLGQPTFAGGAAATRQVLGELGVDVAGLTVVDGSGVSRGNAVPAQVLAGTLSALSTGAAPYGWPGMTGLPVAGATGTLADRYASPATAAGAGTVRAKTGTLTGVNGLAGTVRDADGRLLVFAVLTDRVRDPASAPAALDRIASAIAGCGCR
ncbi:MAG: D-alanyl-D-alanine carboxypeptidase/D-alanyl-D-alanine-endopeptidase [Actinomycetota bacterium]|nr:MAG: D-alanyl-D-alanine carboxypeptidase/D-alanyl-D-alanine-endopeptidase [Actinomycetota bacterium]